MNTTLTIEVHFDLICPWCLIGKRHLSTALESLRRLRPEVCTRVIWCPHPLLPDTPAEGLPYQAFYERRLGSREAVAARRAQVQDAARMAGINFAFERIQVLPNTRLAHRLIAAATRHADAERAAALIDRLFTTYFMDGENIGSRDVLLGIVGDCGLDTAALVAAIASPDADERGDRASTAPADVPGVPFLVFNGRFAVSGAHPPDHLLAVMQRAIHHQD